jgi:hypothetical protein
MHSDLEVWRLKLFWSFEKSGPNRYRLIGIDNYGTALMRAEYAPGYESRQLRDIIKAAWYLNAGSRSDLPDHLIEVLDQFKRDALAHGFE